MPVHLGDSFYLPTPWETRGAIPTAEELEERLRSVSPSIVSREADEASTAFSFSDVEHDSSVHVSLAASHAGLESRDELVSVADTDDDVVVEETSTTDDFSDDYDFVDETADETDDDF